MRRKWALLDAFWLNPLFKVFASYFQHSFHTVDNHGARDTGIDMMQDYCNSRAELYQSIIISLTVTLPCVAPDERQSQGTKTRPVKTALISRHSDPTASPKD